MVSVPDPLDCLAHLLSRLRPPEEILTSNVVAEEALDCVKAFLTLNDTISIDGFTDEQTWAALNVCKHDSRSLKAELKALNHPRLLETSSAEEIEKKTTAKRRGREEKKEEEIDDGSDLMDVDLEEKEIGEVKTKKKKKKKRKEEQDPDESSEAEDKAGLEEKEIREVKTKKKKKKRKEEQDPDESSEVEDKSGGVKRKRDEGEGFRKKQKTEGEKHVLDDGIFKMEEMKEFLDKYDFIPTEDDDDILADYENNGDENALYADFFGSEDDGDNEEEDQNEDNEDEDELALEERELEEKLRQMRPDNSEEEDDEEEDSEGLVDDPNEELSAEEQNLVRALDQYAAKGKEDGDGDEAESLNDEKVERNEEEDAKVQRESLVAADKRIADMEADIARMENEQVADKHWSLQGEANARQRPLNSLLEMHLDLPMSCFASKRAVDQAIALGQVVEEDPFDEQGPSLSAFDLEQLIKQRIVDDAFDDVIRIAGKPVIETQQDTPEVLDFNKSRVGLADIYAKQYEEEVFGESTAKEESISKEKELLKKIFAKTIYKLDQLTNSHFTPRPPMIVKGRKLAVASVQIEEAVPLVMTESQQRAPEEQMAPLKTTITTDDMTPDDKDAHRRAKKVKRRKGLMQKVKDGRISKEDFKSRSEKIAEKNKKAKEEKAAKGKPKEVKRRRIKGTQLLQQAAENSGKEISRKEAMQAFRKSQLANKGIQSSKSLKL